MSKKEVITFFNTLENRKVKKSGLFPVSLVVYHNGTRRRYRTGNELSLKDWERLNKKKLKDEDLKPIREKLQSFVRRAKKVKEDFEKENIPFSFEEFEKKYFNKLASKTELAFSECVNEFVKNYKTDHKEKNLSVKSVLMYETLKNSVLNFKKNIKLNQITPEFLSNYETYLRTTKKGKAEKTATTSTVGIYLRQLRAIVNYAIKKGYYPADKYPFKNYDVPTAENNKRALNNKELKALLNYIPIIEQEQKAIDFWKFSYLGNGANFNDILRLRFKDLKGDFIQFIRTKTKNKQKIEKEIKIFLLPQMKEIIKKYGNLKENENDYVFSIINKNMDAKQELKAIAQFIKITNKYLKRISENLKFDFTITTYYARHSWATKLRNSGVSVSFISEGLGHSSIETTETYLGKFQDEEIKTNASILLDF